jgi:hypothetical protein
MGDAFGILERDGAASNGHVGHYNAGFAFYSPAKIRPTT